MAPTRRPGAFLLFPLFLSNLILAAGHAFPAVAEASSPGKSPPVLAPASATTAVPYSAAPFEPGEVLRYKIKWGPVRLGTMEIRQDRPDSAAGAGRRLNVRLTGRSAQGVPFVHVFFVDNALLDPRDPANWIFTSEDELKPANRTVYRSDSSASEMSIVETNGAKVTHWRRLPHNGPLYDVVGLFMLMRGFSGSARDTAVQTVVEKQVKRTRLRFTDEVRQKKVEGFARPVRVRRFEGQGDWTCKSCAGMTGAFRGWMTDDAAAIPVETAMKIAVGSVVVKLEFCTRPGEPGALGNPRRPVASDGRPSP